MLLSHVVHLELEPARRIYYLRHLFRRMLTHMINELFPEPHQNGRH